VRCLLKRGPNEVAGTLTHDDTEIIKHKGTEKITVDELIAEVTPRGRGKSFLFPFLLLS